MCVPPGGQTRPDMQGRKRAASQVISTNNTLGVPEEVGEQAWAAAHPLA